jgi:N-formylmaleamate deformylase
MLRLLIVCACVLATRLAPAAPAFSAEVTGKGRPVILIPGLGCPASVWTDTAAHLATKHEVHTLALAGFAGKPAIDRPIPSAVKDDVIAYIKEHKLERPVIVGHSLGGFVALWIAEAAPDLVGPVVVVDAGPDMGGGDPDILPFAKKKRDGYRTMPAAAFETGLRERYAAMFSNPKKWEPIIAAVVKSDQRAFGDAYFELFSTDLKPRLAKIATPVLLILADSRINKAIREQMKPVKQLTVVELARTRHFVMHDDFPGFSKALDTFLAAH